MFCYIPGRSGPWCIFAVVEAFPWGLIACNITCNKNRVGLILSVSLQAFKAEVLACLFVVISQLRAPKMLVEHTLHMRTVLVAGSVSWHEKPEEAQGVGGVVLSSFGRQVVSFPVDNASQSLQCVRWAAAIHHLLFMLKIQQPWRRNRLVVLNFILSPRAPPKFWTLFSRVAGVRFVDVLGSGIDLVRVFTRCFNLPLWKVKNQHSSTSPAEAFQCCFDYPWKRLVSLELVLDKLRSFPVVVKLAELNRNRMAARLTQEAPIDPPHPVKRKVDQDGVVSLACVLPHSPFKLWIDVSGGWPASAPAEKRTAVEVLPS